MKRKRRNHGSAFKAVAQPEIRGSLLKAYENGHDAQRNIGQWITFYNSERRHTSLDRHTPDQVYYRLSSELPMAA